MNEMKPGIITYQNRVIVPADIDRVVCEWTMNQGVPLREEQLNSLVDAIMYELNAEGTEGVKQ